MGAKVATGSFAPSRTQTRSSSGSSSSSTTASYDDRPPYSSSRSRSNLTPQADRRSQHSRQHRNRVQPPPADLVAPPLPGYGPPRTTTDSVRRDDRSRGGGGGRRSEAVPVHDEEDSENYSSDEDGATGPYASVPPTAPPSVALRPLPPGQSTYAQSQSGRLLPNPHAAPPPTSTRHYPPASLRSLVGNSPAPSIHSMAPHSAYQQTAIAYPPGFIAPSPIPLTSSNLLQRTSTSATLPATPIAQPPAIPALDAALDRIQTSLTALHERLSILESTPTSRSSSSGSPSAVSQLFKQTLLQFLTLFKLRSNPSAQTPSLRSLLPRLLLALLKTARKLAGDAVVFFAVIVILGRIRGVDLTQLVGNWLARYLVARSGGGKGGKKLIKET